MTSVELPRTGGVAREVGERAIAGSEGAAFGWPQVHVAFVAALVVLAVALRDADWRITAELHTVIEAVATVLALMCGSAALVRYHTRQEGLFLFVGVAFLGAGLLDGYHAVVTATELVGWMPTHAQDLIPWSWGASRFYLGAVLLVGMLSLRPDSIAADTRLGPRPTFLVAGVFLAASVVVFAIIPMPPAHYPTLILSRPQELLPAAMFGICLVIFLRSGAWRHWASANWMMLSLIAGIFCQVVFMATSNQVFDAPFTVAHLLKVASYVLFEIGLLVSMQRVFLSAEQSRQDLLEANAELERYIHIASHDLKGPLRNIDDLAKWSLEDEGSEVKSELCSNLSRIRDRARRLDRMLADLLTYSRIGRRAECPMTVDSEELVRRAFEAARGDRNVDLILTSPLPDVGSAPDLLSNVFAAVLGNAIRHNPQAHGCVRVGAEDVGGGMVRFSVGDNGPGIPSEFRGRVFDLFQTLQPKDRVEGSGMGLTIARKAVGRVGGRIWIEDGLGGVGATVVFDWPRSGLDPTRQGAETGRPDLPKAAE